MRKRFNVLIDLIEKHSFTNMVEIGIGRGECAKEILDVIVPSYPFVYYGIDPYKQYGEYANDINSTPIRLVNNKNAAENNLQSHIKKNRFIHFELKSKIVVNKFKDVFIDLLFIDGNHSYEYVKQDLKLYWYKVRNYGIIALHDYYMNNMFTGVKKAVDEFVEDKGLVLEKDADVVYFYKLPVST